MDAPASFFSIASLARSPRLMAYPARILPVNATPSSDEDLRRREDAALLRRVGHKDEQAFAELYDRFSAGLYSVALRILNDPKDAEDVIQESFQKIWNRAATFDPDLGSGFSWAAMIVWHKAVDRLRVRRRLTQTTDKTVEFQHFAEMDDTSANLPSVLERRGEVRKALASIPDDQQTALNLAFFGGLTHHEIAAQLREPLGTIKARIRRGLLRLREMLKEDA